MTHMSIFTNLCRYLLLNNNFNIKNTNEDKAYTGIGHDIVNEVMKYKK